MHEIYADSKSLSNLVPSDLILSVINIPFILAGTFSNTMIFASEGKSCFLIVFIVFPESAFMMNPGA